MSIKKITHGNGTETPDEIIVDYAIKDAQGNTIDTTYAKINSLAEVAVSGNYTDLIDRPTIPDSYSDLTADINYVKVRPVNEMYNNNAAWNLYLPSSFKTTNFVRITIPDTSLNKWTMLYFEISIMQQYSTGACGKLYIFAMHNATTGNWGSLKGTIAGNLSTTLKYYASDRKYLYIGGIAGYGSISIDKILTGDAIRTVDLSSITIDTVEALPETYQTGTLYGAGAQLTWDSNGLRIKDSRDDVLTTISNSTVKTQLGIPSAGIQPLITNGSATIASVESDVVTIKAGVSQSNGAISNSSGADITLAKVAKTGSYSDLSDTPVVESTPIEDSTNLVSSGGVYAAIEDVREVAEGRKRAIVCSDITNPALNTQEADVVLTTLTDINDVSYTPATLNVGDSVYISQTDVPDRWISNITGVAQVSDLTNTTWRLKDTLAFDSLSTATTFDVSCIVGDANSSKFRVTTAGTVAIYSPDYTAIYSSGTWTDAKYKNVTIINGTDVTNTELANWLYLNSTSIMTLSILETAKVPVNDVKVNNTSVVTNGVAEITIPSIGALDTTATTAQTTSSSESFTGNITLHKISKTGTYSDLIGTPTIPSTPSDIGAAAASHTHTASEVSGLHTVATSGSYTDLSNKPTIPSAPGTLNTTATTAQATASAESLAGSITLHKVSKTGDADSVGTYKPTTYGYLFRSSSTINFMRGDTGTITEEQRLAMTANDTTNGQIYYISDRNVRMVTRVAGTPKTLSWSNVTKNYQQLEDNDAPIYVKVVCTNKYDSYFIDWQVQGSYDNVSGATEIREYCRSRTFYADAVNYNGNKLVAIGQPSANTDIWYFKFSKHIGSYTSAADSYWGSLNFKANIIISSATIIQPSSAEYTTISTYGSYFTTPTNGIKTSAIWNTLMPVSDAQDLGGNSTTTAWNYVYGKHFKIPGGTSSQFLKADGTTDSNSYLQLSGGTLTGNLVLNNTKGIIGKDTSSTNRNILQSTNGNNLYLGDSGWSGIYSYSNLYPSSNNGNDLGSSTYKWNNIHGTTIYEGGVSLANKYAASDHTHTTVVGSYTYSGGQQNPDFFGTNKVGFLMMNTSANNNTHFKDWMIMDCYNGSDVGGTTALGIDRQEMKAFIMGSDASRESWTRAAELATTIDAMGLVATPNNGFNFEFDVSKKQISLVSSQTDWGNSVYSKSCYKECRVTFKPAQINRYIFVGLNANPSLSTGFDIDYSWYMKDAGALEIWEQGNPVLTEMSYVSGDEFSIEYINGKVNYYHNSLLIRSVDRSASTPLYMDTSFYRTSGTIYDVVFEPLASTKPLEIKNLQAKYHLGAFDTLDTTNSNYDLITRKTCYNKLGTNGWSIQSGYTDVFCKAVNNIQNNTTNIKLTGYTYVVSGSTLSDKQFTVVYNYIYIKDNTYDNDLTNFVKIISDIDIQYEIQSDLQYTEKVIKNQPLNTLDQTGSEFVRKEWEKSSNLIKESISADTYTLTLGEVNLKAGTYYLSISSPISGSFIQINETTVAYSDYTFIQNGAFTLTNNISGTLKLRGTYNPVPTISWAMLNEGSHAYSYQPYNGSIVHKADIPMSLPASDVYPWAKAATKPSYTHDEIGAGNILLGDAANYMSYRTVSGLQAGFYYNSTGDESMVFAHEYAHAGWMFVNGTRPSDHYNWQSLSPTLQIKDGGVAINKLIGQGVIPTHALDVNGSVNATALNVNNVELSPIMELYESYVKDELTIGSFCNLCTISEIDDNLTSNSQIYIMIEDNYNDMIHTSPPIKYYYLTHSFSFPFTTYDGGLNVMLFHLEIGTVNDQDWLRLYYDDGTDNINIRNVYIYRLTK